jgi:DNA modification methylase
MADPAPNLLYYGDNLDVLRRHVADESVDLIYLDPPFKSNQDYNVLFAEHTGKRAAAQIKAFEDTWEWDEVASLAFEETVERGGRVADALRAFRTFLGESDMLAYLSMMAPRLVELRRVLTETGSIYLHCDPTASHYLKMLMDAVFGPQNFQNEIVWKRTSAHVNPKRYGPVHDVLLFYSRSDAHLWNIVFQSYEKEYLDTKYRHQDDRGSYRLTDLTGNGVRHGDSGQPWRDCDPNKTARHWAVPREVVVSLIGVEAAAKMTTQEKLDLLDEHAFIYWTPRGKKGGAGFPQLKRFLTGGVPAQDVITDIPPINSQAHERLGYPTQKPEALLDRIIMASSNENDCVLDPFCGCGTAIASAQRLKRRWIGIDITHLAIGLIKHRLHDAFGDAAQFNVVGEPVSVPDAEALAESDPYQFQWWALGLVSARPNEQKKGADRGVDGRLFFHDEERGGQSKQIILSVKAGKTGPDHVRDLRGVVEREKAQIGVLITMQEPTQPMRKEAASAGFYDSPIGKHPRLQLLTVAELLDKKGIDYPSRVQRVDRTFKRAPKAPRSQPAQLSLDVPLPIAAETPEGYRSDRLAPSEVDSLRQDGKHAAAQAAKAFRKDRPAKRK